MQAKQPADVAVAHEHEGLPLSSNPLMAEAAPRVKASSRWKVADPAQWKPMATAVSASWRSSRVSPARTASSDRSGVDAVDGEVEIGRHHGDVADGHGLDGRDEDGAPAHLNGVLRRAHDRGADARRRGHQHRAKLPDTLPNRAGEQWAEVAVTVPVVAVHELGNAAGEDDGADRALVRESRQPHQSLRLIGDTPAEHDLHETVHHLPGDGLLLLVGERPADLHVHARFVRVEAPRLLDADDAVFRVEREEARARVERGDFECLAALADGDLAGAPADVDVHHDAARLLRTRRSHRSHGRPSPPLGHRPR